MLWMYKAAETAYTHGVHIVSEYVDKIALEMAKHHGDLPENVRLAGRWAEEMAKRLAAGEIKQPDILAQYKYTMQYAHQYPMNEIVANQHLQNVGGHVFKEIRPDIVDYTAKMVLELKKWSEDPTKSQLNDTAKQMAEYIGALEKMGYEKFEPWICRIGENGELLKCWKAEW